MSTEFWDKREPNTPADGALGTAIHVWALMEAKALPSGANVTVGEAAAVFHVTPRRAARAIVNFRLMFLRQHIASYGITAEESLAKYSDDELAEMIIAQHDW